VVWIAECRFLYIWAGAGDAHLMLGASLVGLRQVALRLAGRFLVSLPWTWRLF